MRGGAYPLGTFYSEEWKIESGNPFITCKAYDALYSLKDMEIMYPMEKCIENGQTVYKIDGYGTTDGISLYEIIEKVFSIINDTMLEKGLEKSPYTYWVDSRLQNIKVPLALIETKSAWEILQDIANAGCCFVYCDRDGEIYFQRDNFPKSELNGVADVLEGYMRPAGIGDGRTELSAESSSENILITPSNAFSYNLPGINKMIINKASVDYWESEEAEDNKKIDVDIKDCKVSDPTENGGYKILEFVVKPKNVYRTISEITIQDKDSLLSLGQITGLQISYDQIWISLKIFDGEYADLSKLLIEIKTTEGNGKGEEYSKFTAGFSNDDSIKSSGEQEYVHASNKLVNKILAESIAGKIVAKYKTGLSYIETEWKGDAELEPGELFESYDLREQRLAQAENQPVVPTPYECLSNEIKFDGGYRQKTKARQSN